MAFTGIDSIVAALGAGRTRTTPFQKAMANSGVFSVGWGEFFTGTGVPGATPLVASAGVGTPMYGNTHNGIDIGNDVSPLVRHLVSMHLATPTITLSNVITTPAYCILVDLLYTYQSLVITGAPTVLDNSLPLPRYTDGVGVLAISVNQTEIAGGGGGVIFTMNIRSDDDTDADSVNMMHSTSSSQPSTRFGWPSSTLVSGAPPLVPLASGKRGVKRINSYTRISGGTGLLWFGLVKPLACFPIPLLSQGVERDFVFMMPALPRIYDGACLGLLVLVGGATIVGAGLYGSFTFAEG